jgi:signal transduction histidine kinase
VTSFKQLAGLKDEFVATVSHDLRSPLNSILGNIEIAQEERMPEKECREALERAKKTVYRMAALINNLLDLAEVEADIPLRLAPVKLDTLAREAVEDLKHIASSKGISIQYELDQLPPIKADQQLLIRVWHNLIDNAIKYTPEGSITVGVEATENQVLGYVADTGVGIPSSALPFVFDKFFRADQPQAREITGTGLGLSLVKSIIEKHRGQIWVESEPETGSTFTFTLPL